MKDNIGYKAWLARYYPVKPSKKMTWDQAVAHCILKWSGAHEKVLDKYSALKGRSAAIYFEPSGKSFRFNNKTCALCVKTGLNRKDCEPCPLYHVRGRVECSGRMMEEMDSPYDDFIDCDMPDTMLRWLRATRLFLKTKKWREIQNQIQRQDKERKRKGF